MPKKKEKSIEELDSDIETALKADKSEFHVYNNGVCVRVYSVEIHGKDAEAKAKEFASKIGGEVR